MRLQQDKKLKPRRQNENQRKSIEILKFLPRAVFAYFKLFLQRAGFLFTRRRFLQKAFVVLLIFAWIFSGWPRIFNPSTLFRTGFPPKIQEAQAAWGVPKIGSLVEQAGAVGVGDITLLEPAGIAQGDLMVACIGYRGSEAFTLPTGWSLVATQQSLGDVDATNGIASGVMAYIVRGASAPALVFTRTIILASGVAQGRIIAYSGDSSTPYDTGSANTLAVRALVVTTASITTAEANELIVAMVSVGDADTTTAFDAATDPTTPSGAIDTITAPTAGTWIGRSDDVTTTGADNGLAIADAIRSAAGITGTIQATVADDSRNVMIAGAFKINAVPTLSISQPDGVSDTVTVGDLYNITYSLADADNVVTAAFYYDVDADMAGGTAITGACATAAEGTGVTCSWDTTGMTAGSYYVYGATSDGVNPEVKALSPGQITINAAGTLTVDIVDLGGTSVPSPSMAMNAVTFSFNYQTANGTFGVSTEKIRVENTTVNPQWNLTIAANGGSTAFWDGVASDYDFNDPTANAGDGGDADSLGGQMTMNASGGTLGGTCSATDITKGSSASFSEGVTDSITLLTAGVLADTSCYWDLTGISVSQTVPAEQPADSYSINMTLTITAL